MSEELTYKKAGVDLDKAKASHIKIGELIKSTYALRAGKFGEVIGEYGHYAGLISIDDEKALALHADGVGTKVIVAQLMDKYDTVGIDCVAMNANDLICLGAEPIALVDYLAVEEADPDFIEEIMKGLVNGATQANMAIIGGETAVMPDIIKGAKKGKGFDLSALSVGVVNKSKIITGSTIREGDAIVGLKSNGIHSNGLTLARKALLDVAGFSVTDFVDELGTSIGEALLTPTRIYVDEILAVLRNVEVHGLAHITGGSFSKLRRLTKGKFGFLLDNLPTPPAIFKVIQNAGKVSDKEMYRTFNMGVGFCIISPKNTVDTIIDMCRKRGTEAYEIGRIIKEDVVKINIPNTDKTIIL
ncbi:MAG: phosphoribosylformylglycinamidine cyclo-ligase [Candidatus Odinarchaeia archaeon]